MVLWKLINKTEIINLIYKGWGESTSIQTKETSSKKIFNINEIKSFLGKHTKVDTNRDKNSKWINFVKRNIGSHKKTPL